MNNSLGRSVYLSLVKENSFILDEIPDGTSVFISLHMEEEADEHYSEDILELCDRLHDKNCQITADISKRTLDILKTDIGSLVRKFHLWAIRIEYGFSPDEMISIARENNVVLNASTMPVQEILKVKKYGNVSAMHNFYPRKETGLDEDHFQKINSTLKDNGIKVMAFIPGMIKRGPLFDGLPSIEKQRYQNTYISYVEMIRRLGVDQAYLSEPGTDKDDLRRIELFEKQDVISLPVTIDSDYRHLLNSVFTNRIDSPSSLIRIVESREYSRSNGSDIGPCNNIERKAGSITIDNSLYKRYCGELQICVKDHPQDEKVNVIGKVKEGYLDLLKMIERGNRFLMEDEGNI